VSAFGMGGTNAHLVLEEAPVTLPESNELERPTHLLTLSAKTEKALGELANRYIQYFQSSPDASLLDICFTANVGRQHFKHRLFVVANSIEQAREQLSDFANCKHNLKCPSTPKNPKIAFLYTGQGSQYIDMGRQLYETQPIFREAIDRCDQILRTCLEKPLLSVLYPEVKADSPIHQTAYTQPTLFAIEYALTQLWQSWGIQPTTVIGHSVGEYVAACVAGIFSLEDGLRLIAERGRLMQSLPQDGSMVAVFASESKVREAIDFNSQKLAIAAVNSPQNTVISGHRKVVEAALSVLQAKGFETRELKVSHAFHSPLMEPMLDDFEKVASTIRYSAPKIDWVSNLTGDLVTNEVVDYRYWVNHVRQPVQFLATMATLYQENHNILLEVGPKPILLGMGSACLEQLDSNHSQALLCLPSLRSGQSDWQTLLNSLGELYLAGTQINWSGFDEGYSRRRLPLPTYPFQRQRYWIDAVKNKEKRTLELANQEQEPAMESVKDWFYQVEWEASSRQIQIGKEENQQKTGLWLILADRNGLGEELAELLKKEGYTCVVIYAQDSYEKLDKQIWKIDPTSLEDYQRLLGELEITAETALLGVVHLWSLDISSPEYLEADDLEKTQILGCRGALYLTQALPPNQKLNLWLVTRGAVFTGYETTETLEVAQAPLWGLGKVISLEHPEFWGGMVDLDLETSPNEPIRLLKEILNEEDEDYLAFRKDQRYVARLTLNSLQKTTPDVKLSPDQTYLITGGTGALGLRVARWMAELGAKHLALISRSGAANKGLEELEHLKEMGTEVTLFQADVSNQEDMNRVFESIEKSSLRLGGIIHTAGVLDSKLITKIDWESFNKVMAPKVQGTWILHTLSYDLNLDFFVCFSSMAALFGVGGEGSYAAANAFMDALMSYRQFIGLPGLSINWGPWANSGMAANLSERYRSRLTAQGIDSIAPEKGLAALRELLGQASPQVGVLPINWSLYKQSFARTNQVSTLLKSLGQDERTGDSSKFSIKQPEILQKLNNYPSHESHSLLVKYLRQQTAKVLGLASSQLSLEQPLNQTGLDSLMTIELRNTIKNLGVNISLERFVLGINLSQLATEVLAQLKEQNIVKDEAQFEQATESDGEKVEHQQLSISENCCLVIPKPDPDAQIRLIGFPYAGGSPTVFQPWSEELPKTLEMAAIQLPGRGARLKEDFYLSMEQLVDSLTPELIPYLDKPFIFFGHCLGGIQAFEVAQKLRKDYDLQPIHLFTAGSRAPQFYNPRQLEIDIQQFNHNTHAANHELSEKQFIDMLREVNFANNQALFEDEETRNLMLPIIKADYQINNNYMYHAQSPLDIPITAFGGRVDPYVTGEQVLGWSEHTTAQFEVQFHPGDHYFMEVERSSMIQFVINQLSKV
jgi:acyl transferase domain-containing protein/surfactin synthase thioesterase subunit